jgi:hypothetical protein
MGATRLLSEGSLLRQTLPNLSAVDSIPSIHCLLRVGGMALSRPQHMITSPDPDYALKKRRSRVRATT